MSVPCGVHINFVVHVNIKISLDKYKIIMLGYSVLSTILNCHQFTFLSCAHNHFLSPRVFLFFLACLMHSLKMPGAHTKLRLAWLMMQLTVHF